MPLRLRCICAHPDDECFAFGGALALYASMTFPRISATIFACSLLVALCGCGGSPPCAPAVWAITVTPAAATADHAATAPGNQVHFVAVGAYQPTAANSCAYPDLGSLEFAAWSNPDPKDIQISSANDPTNGTATCLATTSGAVTLTGTFSPGSTDYSAGGGTNPTVETVSLTCK